MHADARPLCATAHPLFPGGMNLVTSDYNGVLPARLPQQWISIAQCGQDAGALARAVHKSSATCSTQI